MQAKLTDQEIERHLETVTIHNNDVVLLKGTWPVEMVEQMAENLNAMNLKALLIVLPNDSMDFSTMSIKDFYNMIKACEKQMGMGSAGVDDGVHEI